MKAPVPPRRSYQNRIESPRFEAVGAGINASRALQQQHPRTAKPSPPTVPYPMPPAAALIEALQDAEPDVRIGADVEIRGNFQFDGLLRLDGRFQGTLQSTGDLVVGPGGVLIAEVTTIRRMLVDGGHVYGNIVVDHLAVAGNARIQGNVTCKHLEMQGLDAIIEGSANIHPFAPSVLMDEDADDVRPPAALPPQLPLPQLTPLAHSNQTDNRDPAVATATSDADRAEEARLARSHVRQQRKETWKAQQGAAQSSLDDLNIMEQADPLEQSDDLTDIASDVGEREVRRKVRSSLETPVQTRPASPTTTVSATSATEMLPPSAEQVAQQRRNDQGLAARLSQDEAAIKIQAAARRRLARGTVARKRAQLALPAIEEDPAEEVRAVEEASPSPGPSQSPDEAAAVKVQAVARGRQARSEAKRREAASAATSAPNAQAEEAQPLALDKAATKIQSATRGRQARDEAKRRKATDPTPTIDATEAERRTQDEAATKIQTAARGRRARQIVVQKRSERGQAVEASRLGAEE